jgi:hypothetical protein
MQRPREADIEAAKEYLRQRLDAEYSMTYNLEIVMKEAAERIVEILYSAKIHPTVGSYENLPPTVQMQVDKVVEWLRETIDDYFVTLAIADHEENKHLILPLVYGESFGSNFDERLNDYCGKYRDELMLLIGAGLFLGIAKSALVKSIGENLKHPYANQLLADGIAAPLSYGRGRTNSMFTAIGDLTQYGIAQGWMKSWYIDTKADRAIGWLVQRGSSYSCELCDSYVGFHSDESELPPYHGHCACYAVPIYVV